MSNNVKSFEAEFKLEPDEHRLHREHCKANLKKIQDIGRHRHEQVRIEFETTILEILSLNESDTSELYDRTQANVITFTRNGKQRIFGNSFQV